MSLFSQELLTGICSLADQIVSTQSYSINQIRFSRPIILSRSMCDYRRGLDW
jgi:hypothetical protein